MKYSCSVISGCLLIGLLFAGSLSAEEKIDPPETLFLKTLADLYQPVLFDHLGHSENFECNNCHHHTTGEGAATPFCGKCHSHSPPLPEVSCSTCHTATSGQTGFAETSRTEPLYHIDIPMLKSALHLQCLGCHRREDGPVGCVDCHLFTPKGRKRFGVKTTGQKITGVKQ